MNNFKSWGNKGKPQVQPEAPQASGWHRRAHMAFFDEKPASCPTPVEEFEPLTTPFERLQAELKQKRENIGQLLLAGDAVADAFEIPILDALVSIVQAMGKI